MNADQAAATYLAEVAISPKREVVIREITSLAKMASLLAVPFLLLSLAWI